MLRETPRWRAARGESVIKMSYCAAAKKIHFDIFYFLRYFRDKIKRKKKNLLDSSLTRG